MNTQSLLNTAKCGTQTGVRMFGLWITPLVINWIWNIYNKIKKLFDKYPNGSYTVCNWYGKKLGTINIVDCQGFSWYEFGTSYIVHLCVFEEAPAMYILSTKFNGKYTNSLTELGEQRRAEAIVDKELRKLRFAWVRRYQ